MRWHLGSSILVLGLEVRVLTLLKHQKLLSWREFLSPQTEVFSAL